MFKQQPHQGERKKNNLHSILYPDRQIILGSCDNLKSETQDRMMTWRWRQSRSRKGEAWIEQNKKQQKQKEILRDVFFKGEKLYELLLVHGERRKRERGREKTYLRSEEIEISGQVELR